MGWIRLVAGLAAGCAVGACMSADGTSVEGAMGVGTQVVNDRNVVQMLAPDERTSELAIDGITLSESPWSSMDYTDTVLVINVWGSWCPPCVAEMPELVEVANEFADEGKPVQFLGINTRDSTATAQAFERRFGVPYPSLQYEGGRALAQLDKFATASPPITLVLDQDALVAARINGQTDASTLRGLIDDVLTGDDRSP